jgi:hypothetical protein
VVEYYIMRNERNLYEQMNYENHRERLKKVKSSIDNSPPANTPTFFSRKWELENNRKIAKINQENKYLVSRLMNQTSVLDNAHDARMKEVREFKKKLSEMRKNNY